MIYPESYVVFDFETYGLDWQTCPVLEVGAIKVTPRGITEFERILKWELPIPTKITELTGITPQMQKEQGVDPKETFKEFYHFIDGLPLIGHCIRTFDFHFLDAWCGSSRPNNWTLENHRTFINNGLKNCIDTAALFKAQELKLDQKHNERHSDFAKRVLEVYAPGVKYNVAHCCKKLEIPNLKGQHRALADVHLTNEIYKRLCLGAGQTTLI